MPLPKSYADLDKIETNGPSERPNCLCNRYDIIETIGVGSYGSVYKVNDLKCKDIKAAKVIGSSGLESLPDDHDVTQEAQILAKLSHPNIVKFTDAFSESQNFYIVMEFCPDGSLDDFMEVRRELRSPLTHDHIWCWTAQIAAGLCYIQSQRILHRDLKPKNIFLMKCTEKSWPHLKIGDFGISKTLFNSTDAASTWIGTPYYFSPEIFKQNKYDQKTDMWALGCILYELCNLKHPFAPAENLPQLMHRVVTKEPRYDLWQGPDLCLPLCQQLLAKNPKKRPTANQVLVHKGITSHLDKHSACHKCAGDDKV